MKKMDDLFLVEFSKCFGYKKILNGLWDGRLRLFFNFEWRMGKFDYKFRSVAVFTYVDPTSKETYKNYFAYLEGHKLYCYWREDSSGFYTTEKLPCDLINRYFKQYARTPQKVLPKVGRDFILTQYIMSFFYDFDGEVSQFANIELGFAREDSRDVIMTEVYYETYPVTYMRYGETYVNHNVLHRFRNIYFLKGDELKFFTYIYRDSTIVNEYIGDMDSGQALRFYPSRIVGHQFNDRKFSRANFAKFLDTRIYRINHDLPMFGPVEKDEVVESVAVENLSEILGEMWQDEELDRREHERRLEELTESLNGINLQIEQTGPGEQLDQLMEEHNLLNRAREQELEYLTRTSTEVSALLGVVNQSNLIRQKNEKPPQRVGRKEKESSFFPDEWSRPEFAKDYYSRDNISRV